MRQLIDQLQVWHAMRDQKRGLIDYDRLAKAGTPGEIVLHNILGRLLDDVTAANRRQASESDETQDRVELGRGGAISYPTGQLMVAEAVVLVARLDAPGAYISPTRARGRGVTGANIRYTLANEPSEHWGTYANVAQREALILGAFSGPFDELERRAIDDHSQALTDPTKFIVATTERFVNARGLEALSFLGHDAMSGLVAGAGSA